MQTKYKNKNIKTNIFLKGSNDDHTKFNYLDKVNLNKKRFNIIV